MDLFPTFASLAGCKLPEQTFDGFDASHFLTGRKTTSPRDEYLYYTATRITGVRSGRWKLVLPRPAKPADAGWWGRMIEAIPANQLYDLTADPGETKDLASQHPETVADLMKRVERARGELGDFDRVGSGARFFDDGPKRPDMNVSKLPKKDAEK